MYNPRVPKTKKSRKDATLQRSVKLHAAQFGVYRSNARFRTLVMGRRGGKSYLSMAEIIRAISIPRQDVWYVAPTYRMAKSIMWEQIKKMIPKEWVVKINQTAMTIQLANGSLFQCKGADNYDSLRGAKVDFVVLDEFQLMDARTWYEAIRPTLSTTAGKALFIGTPAQKNHLYDMYMEGQKPENIRNGSFRSWQYTTSDSPFVPPLEIAMAKKELDPKTFSAEYLGSFENFNGLVYYGFNRKTHMGDYAFDPSLPIWVGQDFNVDPMAAAVMQYHPDTQEIWVIDEIILANSNTPEAVEELERRYWKHKKNTTIYPDASGDSRSTRGTKSDLDIFMDSKYHRIKYKKKNPRIDDRINSVNRMLMSADGVIRLRVDNKCKHVMRAFEQVIYKPGTRDVDKSANIEHVLDAIGYCINYEFPTKKLPYIGLDL